MLEEFLIDGMSADALIILGQSYFNGFASQTPQYSYQPFLMNNLPAVDGRTLYVHIQPLESQWAVGFEWLATGRWRMWADPVFTSNWQFDLFKKEVKKLGGTVISVEQN